jgi:hypothetical protein
MLKNATFLTHACVMVALSCGVATGATAETFSLRSSVSKFADVTLSGDAQATHLTTEWEADMENTDGDNFPATMVKSGKRLYTGSTGENTNLLCLRVYNSETGDNITTQTLDIPAEIGDTKQRTFQFATDDDGAVLALVANPSTADSITLDILIYEIVEENGKYRFSSTPTVIHPMPEFLNIDHQTIYRLTIERVYNFNGSYREGNFTIECLVKRLAQSGTDPQMRWSHTILSTTTGDDGTNCKFDDIVYLNSKDSYTANIADMEYIAGSSTGAVITIPIESSSYDIRLWPGGMCSDEQYQALESMEVTNESLYPKSRKPGKGAGFRSFLHNGHSMLIMPGYHTKEEGVTFNIMEWNSLKDTQVPTFADLSLKWQLPSTQPFTMTKFFGWAYLTTILIDPEKTKTTADAATTYFYVSAPGCGIGAYKISTPNSPMPTSIQGIYDESNHPTYHLDGRMLTIDQTTTARGADSYTVAVRDLSGRLLLTATGNASTGNVDLTSLMSGCYLVTINGVTTKLHLR